MSARTNPGTCQTGNHQPATRQPGNLATVNRQLATRQPGNRQPATKHQQPSKIIVVPIESLYDTHASHVYALALRITGDRDIAAEVVEEVFLGMRNGTLEHDPARGSLEAWLIRTARDIAIEHREGQSAAPAVHSAEATPRALVEAAFYGGLSVAELARAFSLTEEEVRHRLRSGMAALRTQFAGTAIR